MILETAKRGRGTATTLKNFADRLRTVPGQWTDYPFAFTTTTAAAAAVRNIRKGTKAFPAGQFEAQRADGMLPRVIVRFVGATD